MNKVRPVLFFVIILGLISILGILYIVYFRVAEIDPNAANPFAQKVDYEKIFKDIKDEDMIITYVTPSLYRADSIETKGIVVITTGELYDLDIQEASSGTTIAKARVAKTVTKDPSGNIIPIEWIVSLYPIDNNTENYLDGVLSSFLTINKKSSLEENFINGNLWIFRPYIPFENLEVDERLKNLAIAYYGDETFLRDIFYDKYLKEIKKPIILSGVDQFQSYE